MQGTGNSSPSLEQQTRTKTLSISTEKHATKAYTVPREGKRNCLPTIISGWKYELANILLASLSTLGTAAIIYTNQDCNLTNWTFFITPNAAISILMTLSKLSILYVLASCIGQIKWIQFSLNHSLKDFRLYDDATRGPTGSVKVLWNMKAPSLLAKIGAFLTVASLAVGPTTQQILTFPSHFIPDAGNTNQVMYADAYQVPSLSNMSNLVIGTSRSLLFRNREYLAGLANGTS